MKKAPKRKISFIVVWCCLILIIRCQGQDGASGKGSVLPGKLVFVQSSDWTRLKSGNFKDAQTRPILTTNTPLPIRVLSADYYVQNFGFFCKKEWEFEKKTHVPLKFRLGSLDYVNRLEGK